MEHENTVNSSKTVFFSDRCFIKISLEYQLVTINNREFPSLHFVGFLPRFLNHLPASSPGRMFAPEDFSTEVPIVSRNLKTPNAISDILKLDGRLGELHIGKVCDEEFYSGNCERVSVFVGRAWFMCLHLNKYICRTIVGIVQYLCWRHKSFFVRPYIINC
jgi:hypothetical protein